MFDSSTAFVVGLQSLPIESVQILRGFLPHAGQAQSAGERKPKLHGLGVGSWKGTPANTSKFQLASNLYILGKILSTHKVEKVENHGEIGLK